MTSSIKDPTVTDAMIATGCEIFNTRGRPLREVLPAIYTAMRSMEAKPDPEGLKVLNGLREVLDHMGAQLSVPGYNRVKDAILFLEQHSAKPSLEPTRTAAGFRKFPQEQSTADLLDGLADRLEAANEALTLAERVLSNEYTSVDDWQNAHQVVRNALLSRKQSGGGNA